jgi:geranylgeranyl diphosphate synthase, type II
VRGNGRPPQDALAPMRRAFESHLARTLELHADPGGALGRAIRYAALSPGKRLRPLLVLAACEAVGGAWRPALPAAAAIECVHAFSLVHDDLPAMDDDDLRRGRPTNHKMFGEAVAILAGDGLLTEAFAVLAGDAAATVPADRRLAAIRELAVAAGAEGMVGGQTADILAEGTAVDLAHVEGIHRRKTGALLRAAVRIGGILAGADQAALDKLSAYGEAIGLAFQVADDILDETGNIAGKTGQRDRELGKSTYPAALGLEGARRLLGDLLERALAAVESFGEPAELLRMIAKTIVVRAL